MVFFEEQPGFSFVQTLTKKAKEHVTLALQVTP
jgi:hypothetical protein